MSSTVPSSLPLSLPPTAAIPVTDVDEEIFLLYTRKQAGPPHADKASANKGATTSGLGFVDSTREVLPLSVTIRDPALQRGMMGTDKRSVKGRAGQSKSKALHEEMTFEVELMQNLNVLKNAKGDTGSIVWRLSLDLASYLLTCAYYPSSFASEHPPLIPALNNMSIIELGAGTGFLGCLLMSSDQAREAATSSRRRSTLNNAAMHLTRPGRWLFTDLPANLPLIVRNLTRNGLSSDFEDPHGAIDVGELDWLDPSPMRSSNPAPQADSITEAAPLLLLAVDCLYNPALSQGLAQTLSALAGEAAIGGAKSVSALVASELRDEDALEVFLREWVDQPAEQGGRACAGGEKQGHAGRWTVARVDLGGEWAAGIGRSDVAVWIGSWQAES